ncbi:MAG: porin [Candidatus Scalindua sp.]|nr:porin [Candidatus Scalindua sp.]
MRIIIILMVVFIFYTCKPMMSEADSLPYSDFSETEPLKNIKSPKFPPLMGAFWNKGLLFKSEDANFELKLDGRIMHERSWFDVDNDILKNIGDQVESKESHRVRLNLNSEIYKNTEFTAQYNFDHGGSQNFNDVYVEVKKIPFLGNLRFGHLKEPFSLEDQTPGKYITFMEQSVNSVFAQSRNIGFILYNHVFKDRMRWATNAFRITDDFDDSKGDSTAGDGYSFSGRITGLPVYKEKGNRLIHTGFSYSYQNAFENKFSFASPPERRLADDFVDTGEFRAESAHLFNPELTIVYGPFSLQSEYTFADIKFGRDTPGPNTRFTAFYVSVSYFLTGERKKYDTETGKLDRINPNKNFYLGKSLGAIELTARYSELDLPYKSVAGDKLSDATLGINWYLNPNTKIIFNYVYADGSRSKDGDEDLAAMRFQFDF